MESCSALAFGPKGRFPREHCFRRLAFLSFRAKNFRIESLRAGQVVGVCDLNGSGVLLRDGESNVGNLTEVRGDA